MKALFLLITLLLLSIIPNSSYAQSLINALDFDSVGLVKIVSANKMNRVVKDTTINITNSDGKSKLVFIGRHFKRLVIIGDSVDNVFLLHCIVDDLQIGVRKINYVEASNSIIKIIRIFGTNNAFGKPDNKSFGINNFTIDKVLSSTIAFKYCNIKSIFFHGLQLSDEMDSENNTINNFSINDCLFKSKFTLIHNYIDNFLISDTKFEHSPVILTTTIFKNITLNYIRTAENEQLNLTLLLPAKERKCLLEIYNNLSAKIIINYAYYKLSFKHLKGLIGAADPKRAIYLNGEEPDTTSIKNQVYQLLLANQKENNFPVGYKNLDLEYQDFYSKELESSWLRPTYWARRIWSNFGYDKWHIFIISFTFFLFFSIFNTRSITYLINHVYSIPKLKAQIDDEPNAGKIRKFVFSILFTAIVFFGLKLDVDNMHFKHMAGIMYILSIFTTGLICTAFMFNYFVSN